MQSTQCFRLALTSFVSVAALAAALPAAAHAQATPIRIDSQPLGMALNALSSQTGVVIIAPSDLVDGKTAPAVRGTLDFGDALAALLTGSGLEAQSTDGRTSDLAGTGAAALNGPVVLVEADPTAVPAATTEHEAFYAPTLDVITVTAAKREQNILDVPVSVTTLGEFALNRAGADSYDDYLALVPGAVFNESGAGNNLVTIRGIQTAQYSSNQQGTIEVLFDDVPSLNRYYARFNTDLRLVDVERVEVLRGPQGTLYGSGAMGGAIKIINHRPDLSEAGGTLDVGTALTDGGDASYRFEGVANLPLVEDVFGLRAVAYSIRDGGFVDNIRTGEDNVDDAVTVGGRLMASFDPDGPFSAHATLIFQDDDTGAAPITLLDAADGRSDTIDSFGPERSFDGQTAVFNLSVEYDLGWADLFSSTSYLDRSGYIDRDWTRYWQSLRNYDGAVQDTVTSDTRTFSQEVRLASQGDNRFDWLVGAFFLDQEVEVRFLRTQEGSEAALGAPGDVLSDLFIAPSTQEIALFGEVSYDVTPALTLTAGARWFENNADFESVRSGLFGGAPTPPRSSSESAITPKIAVLYRLSDTVSVYGQAAQGYRTGQNNFARIDDPDSAFVPPTFYESDSLWNYEAGIRGSFLDGRVQASLAAYHIDWSDIQLTVRGPTGTFTDNAGNAVSRGFEAEFQARPAPWFSFGSAIAYTDAELEDVKDGVTVRTGRLPGSSEWATSSFAEFSADTVLLGNPGYLRLFHRYVGEQEATIGQGGFDAAGLTSDSFNEFDVRAGLEFDAVEVSVFVENLTNEDASLAPRRIPNTPDATTRLRPRTIGVNVRARF